MSWKFSKDTKNFIIGIAYLNHTLLMGCGLLCFSFHFKDRYSYPPNEIKIHPGGGVSG